MSIYEPELGQMVFGNPTGEHGVPCWAEDMVRGILLEVRRVYWNTHQEDWDYGYCTVDPEIPGLVIRPYYWGDCTCGADVEDHPHTTACPVELPNLECAGLRLRWYKYFGRGMSCEAQWTPAEWAEWRNRAAAIVQAADVRIA